MEGFWSTVAVAVLVYLTVVTLGQEVAVAGVILMFAVWLAMTALKMLARHARRADRRKARRASS